MPEESSPGAPPTPDKRLAIINGVLAGKKQSQVALEHQVSRQYVSVVMKNYYADPANASQKKKRGRRPSQLLTPAEARILQEFFLTETPRQHGFDTPRWRPRDARKLVIKRTGKYVTIQRLRAQLREWGVATQPEWDRDSYLDDFDDKLPPLPSSLPSVPLHSPLPAPKHRERKRRQDSVNLGPAVNPDSQTYSEEEILRMEQANREIMARLQRAREEELPAQPTGRHTKQKRRPFTPSKKKKRQKR